MTSSYFEGGGEAVSSLKPPLLDFKSSSDVSAHYVAFLYGVFFMPIYAFGHLAFCHVL